MLTILTLKTVTPEREPLVNDPGIITCLVRGVQALRRARRDHTPASSRAPIPFAWL